MNGFYFYIRLGHWSLQRDGLRHFEKITAAKPMRNGTRASRMDWRKKTLAEALRALIK